MIHNVVRRGCFVLILFVVLGCLGTDADAQRLGRGRSPNVALFLSDRSEIQEELRLSNDQVQFLEALQRDLIAQGPRRPRDDGADIDTKLFATIFRPDQASRFAELLVQFEGLRAFERKEVRDSVSVTDEQLQQIRDLSRASNAEHAVATQLTSVLTDEQLTRWRELCGAEFTFSPQTDRWRQMMRRFGRAGDRGGGRPFRPPAERSDDGAPE